MFGHILVATDFSKASDRALDLASGLARSLRACVTVVHVYETSEAASPARALAAEHTWPRAIRARAKLDDIVNRLRAGGVDAEGTLRFGLLPDPIVDLAQEIGADLIVTGTNARKGVARFWCGSIAEQVLRHSPIPVLAAVPRDGAEVSDAPANVVQLRRR